MDRPGVSTRLWVLLLIVGVAAVISVAWYSVTRAHQGETTAIAGTYLAVGNPCTTRPCLPGVVYAVLADDTYYYLTVEGSFLWSPENDNRFWEGYTPREGDRITVTGYVSADLDVFGNTFHMIEVLSLKPAG